MQCNSSKFLIISILTFLVGIGVVQVWQSFNNSNQISETKNRIISNVETERVQLIQNNPCNELKKIEKTSNYGQIVSVGVINQRMCNPIPFRPIDKERDIEGVDYVIVTVTVDQNGFIQEANSSTNSDFAKQVIKLSKNLRMPPVVLGGKSFRSVGLLVFYPKEGIPTP